MKILVIYYEKCDIIWNEFNEDRILKRYSLNIVTSVLKTP
jgi:hypothetical protein